MFMGHVELDTIAHLQGVVGEALRLTVVFRVHLEVLQGSLPIKVALATKRKESVYSSAPQPLDMPVTYALGW